MSIADVSLERSDSLVSDERLSLLNMPFSSWTATQLATSSLYPQKYQLRPIEDKGSIADSLTAANIDLFDRIPTGELPLIRTLKMVALFAIAALAVPVSAAVGVCYHGAVTAKRLVVWITSKGEAATHNWKEVKQSAVRFMQDGLISLLPLVLSIQGVVGGLVSVGILGSSVFNSRMIARYSKRTECDRYGFYKSLELRKEFGIISAQNKKLLSWDPVKDQDVEYGFRLFNFVGHFGKLYYEQGIEFLMLVEKMQQKLPKDCPLPFMYPPKADTIIAFFEKHPVLPRAEMDAWKQKFKTLETNMNLTKDLIERAFDASQYDRRFQPSNAFDFPLNKEACRAYFGVI